MNPLWIALGFLTRFPVKRADFNPIDVARSVFWFPLAGFLIGAFVSLAPQFTSRVLGANVAAFVAVAVWVALTGALHLDGLADTFDGFSAANSGKERALAAMKDSRIGAHGACALILLLLGKWVLLLRLIELNAVIPSVIGAAILSRVGIGFMLAWAKPATLTGLGVLFAQELHTARGRWLPWSGLGWLPLALASAWALGFGQWTGTLQSLGGSIVVAGGALLAFARRCDKCFGGVTGDTHGAAIELVELLVLALHAVVFGMVDT